MILPLFLIVATAGSAASEGSQPDAGIASDAEVILADGGADAADSGRGRAAISTDMGGQMLSARDAPGLDAVPSGRLQGRIFAKGSRTPVVAAVVTAGASPVAETSSDGNFAAILPCGLYRIAIQAPAFEIQTLTCNVCVDVSPLVVHLAPREHSPVYETIVTATAATPAVPLSGQELTQTPGTFGDPFRVLDTLPGVASPAWPASIYAVRGANPGNTGFMLDDLRMPELFHLALGPSVIHPYFLQGLEFFPGGYPARYGRAVSGLVSARTRAPATEVAHASAEVRVFDASVLLSVPLPGGNGGVAAAVRYSYTGALLSLLSPSVHLGYWDYQVRADRRVGAVNLTLLLLGSGDTLVPRADIAPKREYDLRFHRASLRARASLGPGELDASLAAGIDHSRAPLVENFPLVVDASSVMPRLAYRLPTQTIDWEAGFDGEMQWFSPTMAAATASRTDLGHKRTAKLAAFYTSANVRVGERLRVTPALRLDSYAIGGAEKWDVGPRLAARLDLDDWTWLHANGGRFTQPPSFPLQIPGAENFGLALYGLQTSWQGSVGVGTKRIPGVEVEATGYVQRYVLTDLKDAAVQNPDPLADNFLVRRDALSYGLELMVRRPQSNRLHGWLSYTLSQNLRALGNGVTAPSDWDQRHILNLVLGYRLGRTTLGGRAYLNTGRPVLVRGNQAEVFVRLPTYYQVDLRADRRFHFNTFTLDVYIECMNTTLNRDVFELSQDSSGQVSQRSYRLVLPSLGVRAEY